MKKKVFCLLFSGIMFACSEQKPLDIPPAPPQEEQEQFVPVEKLVFRLNGGLCASGGANPPDTIKLYEEGLPIFQNCVFQF